MTIAPGTADQLRLVDSHAHLDDAQFDSDREQMLQRARAAGVSAILAIGCNIHALDAPSALVAAHDWIYSAAGIHPHEAKLASRDHYDLLNRLALHPKFLAWGEIGLDYHYDHSPRDAQHRVFIQQLELARAARLPVVIHCREAWSDCLEILERHWRSSGLGGILHCFSGTLVEAQRGIAMGFLVSFAANVTYPKAQNLRDIARELPLENLLTETDSPYLAPQPQRGKRNEPSHVAAVAQTLGPVRNLAPVEFAAATSDNFWRFFELRNGSAGRA
jgi:TatD DNase family protein